MPSYISSNQNRFYAAVESTYGQAQVISSANRFPAMHVKASQMAETAKRLNKTGTRTQQGMPSTGRQRTAFNVRGYLSAWNGSGEPAYGPLLRAACGAAASISNGILINSVINSTEVVTSSPHGLLAGAGISWSNELRFVTQVLNEYTLIFNAPFTTPLKAGVLLGPTVTYRLSTNLPSFTLYDYWSPEALICRLVSGCAVDTMEVVVNGDYHELHFSGPASGLVNANTLSPGDAGLSAFPAEPAISDFNGSGVPGHLGQVWLGSSSLQASQFFTLTDARIKLNNNLDLRRQEFGLAQPAAIVPGQRLITSSFSILVLDDVQTLWLYGAAKQRQPFPTMLQLGTQQGQLMGFYLPQMIADLPDYNDGGTRLSWDFKNTVAQGASDDELFIAFA